MLRQRGREEQVPEKELESKTYLSPKGASKGWVVHPTPPPRVMTRDLPHPHHQMRSRTRYNSPCRLLGFAPSTSSLPIDGEHQHPLEGSRVCQEDTGNDERSKKSVSREAAHITLLPLPWDPGNDKNLPGEAKWGRIARCSRRANV